MRRIVATALLCTACGTAAHPRDDTPPEFASPEAVAQAWLVQWCTRDWREPRNANIQRAARFQTTTAAVAEYDLGDDEHAYELVRQQQLSSRCDQVQAQRSPEAPSTPVTVYLHASARRIDLAAGVPFGEEPIVTTRRVVRQDDGRWLVDIAVEAG